MPDLAIEQVKGLPTLPTDPDALAVTNYTIGTTEEKSLDAPDDQVNAEVWFKTPPLPIHTTRRIDSIQLFAESHDQGFSDVPENGNWTWFEIAILDDENATKPRVKDGIELVFESHRNRFLQADYGWEKGAIFDENHALLRLIEDGNVLAVRICARYPGWTIDVRAGYLLIEMGEEELVRKEIKFNRIVSEVQNISESFHEVNAHLGSWSPSLPENLFRADVFCTGGERPLRVLSLDGGGVRGLSALHLLKAVFEKAKITKKPCEVFDLIGGTSTGGLIAIMLGRLQMTIDECIGKYTDFMTEVFKTSSGGKIFDFIIHGEFYDAKILEKKIKEVIREKLKTDPDQVKMLDENNPCKIFCMAVRKDGDSSRGPVFLRSYTNPQDQSLLPDIKLWEAARATSAAPAYFEPLKVGDYELIDGGMGANNPLGWLWTEALALYGPARPTTCFLSIGTGVAPNSALSLPGVLPSHAVESGFASIASNSQLMHVLFKALINAFAPAALAKKYFRLNLSEEIPEWTETKVGWFGERTVVRHLADFKAVGDLDDVKGSRDLVRRTLEWVKAQGGLIEEAGAALAEGL